MSIEESDGWEFHGRALSAEELAELHARPSEDQPKVSGLSVGPGGAQLFVKHGDPVHIAVLSGEPFSSVFVNGKKIIGPDLP